MNKLILLALVSLLATGCATQDVAEQDKAGVEQRDLLESQRKAEDEEARRRALAAKEQEDLDRKLDEERRRQAEAAAQARTDAEIKALQEPSVNEKPLTDAGTQLRDANGALAKRSVYYDFDRYDVREEFRPLIEAHAGFLMANDALKIRVEGNCDERGSTEYNLALGQRRADSVKRALMVLGVRADRVQAVSFGEEKPKAAGQDEDSYAENRRSDIVYPNMQ